MHFSQVLRYTMSTTAVALVVLVAVCVSYGTVYQQTNLISDGSVSALNPPDASLVNPWGIATSPTSPFWVSNNATGTSTLYNSLGAKQGLTVTIPAASGGTNPAPPTGVVFNSFGTDFAGSHFIFATEDGTVASWTSGTSAVLQVNNFVPNTGPVYKGLTLGSNSSGDFLYVANFRNGTINVFDKTFAPTTLSGSFVDPGIPAGFAPFNILNLGGNLFVTYALQDAAKHDDVSGVGLGYVSEFDTNGSFIARIATQGPLNSPWGLAIAPAGFGQFAGDLLVGNFGDGRILAYKLGATPVFDGSLQDSLGNPIVNLGLWGLIAGNGGSGGDLGKVYFAAGGATESSGLLGVLSPVVPEPATLMLLALGGALIVCRRRI